MDLFPFLIWTDAIELWLEFIYRVVVKTSRVTITGSDNSGSGSYSLSSHLLCQSHTSGIALILVLDKPILGIITIYVCYGHYFLI